MPSVDSGQLSPLSALATFAVDRATSQESKKKIQQLCVHYLGSSGQTLDRPRTGHDQMKMCTRHSYPPSPLEPAAPFRRRCRRLSQRVHNYYFNFSFAFCAGHVWRCTRISRMPPLPAEFVISHPASHFSYLVHFECHLATATRQKANPTR